MMTNNHDYAFFGQASGLILSSSSSTEPYIFFKCLKKKSDDSWEKLKEKEGKIVKLSLEEMVMVQEVIKKKSSEWLTFHEHDGNKTKISFSWDDKDNNKLNVNIGEYFKPLNQAQVGIMRKLFRHIIEEKIVNATTFANLNKRELKNQLISRDNSTRLKIEEVRVERNNDTIKINGKVNGETDKALMIQFNNGKESWIPKSTIHSQYDNKSTLEQEISIDEWVLKKNEII